MGSYQKASDLKNKIPSSGSLKAKLPASKKVQVILLISLLLIVGFSGWLYQRANKPTATREETQAVIERAQEDSENAEAAISVLKQAYDDAASDEGRAEAAINLAVRYGQVEDYKQSLKFFQIADNYTQDEDVNIILGVADAAEQTGNNALAKDYYQKAIDYYESQTEDDEDFGWLIANFQDRISRL